MLRDETTHYLQTVGQHRSGFGLSVVYVTTTESFLAMCSCLGPSGHKSIFACAYVKFFDDTDRKQSCEVIVLAFFSFFYKHILLCVYFIYIAS